MKKLIFIFFIVSCVIPIANSQTVIYNIPVAQLVNAPNPVVCPPNTGYYSCAGDMGFSWTSTNASIPSSITVEFNYDIDAGPGTNAYGTTLNGAAQPGTFTPPVDVASCVPDNIYTFSCNPANYNPLALNTFIINSTAGSTCSGLNTTALLGGFYARVTVNYGVPTPPVNDDPCTATALTVSGTCTYNNFSNALAGNSVGVPAPGCAVYSGGDVWFTAVVPASGYIAFNTQQGIILDGGMAVYSGSCGSLTLVACDDNSSANPNMPMISLSGQTPGATLWVRFWENGNDNNGSFGICAFEPPPPPVNDNPCSATALTVLGSCTYNNFTTISATSSPGVPAPGCAGYSGGDVWFTAVVPATGIIAFDSQQGVIIDGGMAVYSGSCGALTLIACDDNSSLNAGMPAISLTGQTPGATLWIRYWENGNNNNGTFGICAFSIPAPVNDDPCAATALTVFGTCTYTTFTNTSASGSAGVPAPGCAGYSGGDVWFTAVVPANGIITFDTQQGTVTDGGMAVYSGSCASLSLIACNDNGSFNPNMPMISLTGQTPGATLWIRFWENGNNNNGTFGICAQSPPPGLCYSGTPIPFAPDAYAGTSVSLTDDLYSPAITIPFSFCMDGSSYNQLLISSNAYVDFDLTHAGMFSPYNSGPIPTAFPAQIMRSILSPMQDINPGVGGQIRYQTLGTAPNRRFVVSWLEVPMFSCTSLLHTGQLKLFESTNCMEIHLSNKPLCTTWNSGIAIEGYNNYNGTQAWFVTGRNSSQWSVSNDAVRYSPTCTPCSTAVTATCLVPLPVELNTFDGFCDNGTVTLRWSTTAEINNDYFILERSNDGINYKEIGRSIGSGNSYQHQEYQFQDVAPIEGNGYYRVKQVDYNGEFKIYPPLSVYCFTNEISLYPNPTHGEFNILGANENDKITITDPVGNILLQTKASGKLHSMNLGDLSAGIYFVSINHNHSIFTRKLIID